jgi:FdrA protein
MIDHLEVRSGTYADSVTLMQVSRRVGEVAGVDAALIAMATELNLELLAGMGFAAAQASPNDLVVAVRAADDDVLAAALDELAAALAAASGEGGDPGFGDAPAPRTVRDAAALGGDLVLVSTPGEHAFVEALDALRAGLHVMVFSDNVPIELEVALKQEAAARGLLVMGPDAGTAIVAGVGLGFANVVAPGPVGIVAAAGTGAQQLTCLLDDAGIGVGHVLGVGGRDLSTAVGGLATRQALDALDRDPATELIVLLSKLPAAEVAERIRAAAESCATPVVLGLLGPDDDDLTAVAASTIDRLGVAVPTWARWGEPPPAGAGTGGRLVGLFAGGTLATEARLIARAALGEVASNLDDDVAPPDEADGTAHLLLDLGADEYTRGRPHPMIDQHLRLEHMARAVAVATTRALLLDVVLGHGAHPDPAAELAPAIRSARAAAREAGRTLDVVVSLCATTGDPQSREAQAERLAAAGAYVTVSNAVAARAAVAVVS